MADKYRPSNASEGHAFEAAWCATCRMRDADGNCQIQLATMAFQEDDEDYPDQWTYDDGGAPICTEYAKEPNDGR